MEVGPDRAETAGWEPGQVVEIEDERQAPAQEALAIIRESFEPHERQSREHFAMEIRERRLGLPATEPYHVLAILSETGQGMAVAAGVYLSAVNAGLVTYLGVRPEYRERKLGRRIRRELVEALRADARHLGHSDLSWVVGEVRMDSPWLRRLVRERAAIPFDFTYYHPGVGPGRSDERWILYRQPLGDERTELPSVEVKRLVYDLWQRAYRVRWPLEHDGFSAMIDELEGKPVIGAHRGVAG